MTTFTRLALGFIGAAVPILAMAAPANVTGIRAEMENGGVRVSWTQAEGEISAYRIYYSHASILGNNGLYDDFESVDGSVNTHLLRNLPPADELFVSILAVDANGEESEYFLEEARVQLRETLGSSSAAMEDDGVLRLLRAEALSATGVTLTFTHSVNISQQQAQDAIRIDYGSGETLGLRRFIVKGSSVIVHTATQEHGTVYRVSVTDAVTGNATTGTGTITLADDQTPVLFTGHPDGAAPAPDDEEEIPAPPAVIPEVAQLRLNAQPAADNTYTVEATWQPPAGTIAGYSVAQTVDGGVTYSQPNTVDKAATAVKIPGVPAGRFGVLIRVTGANGALSRGIMQSIDLPALQDSPLPGTVIPMPGKGGDALPDSGPALWLAISGLGASVGAWRLRRKREA